MELQETTTSPHVGFAVSKSRTHDFGGLPLARLAAIAIILAYGALSLYHLGTPDLEVDEARYGISALNMLDDYHQVAIVSPDPGGTPWSTWPFAYPAMLAGSILLLGKTEFALRLVDVLLMLLTALCVYRLTVSLVKDRTTALFAFGLFLLNPSALAYGRAVMAEPAVVFWGCLALVAAAGYCESRRVWYVVLCGIALGLGFLSKLWLILPFCAASAFLLLSCYRDGKRGKITRDVALGVAVFVIVAGSHLGLLRLLSPGNLHTWLGIYFVDAFTARAGGADYDPGMWFKPWWFYSGALFKCLFFGLPLLWLGISDLVRRRQFLVLGCTAWLIAPVIALSLFKVKEAVYISQAYPALALLMACGLRSFVRMRRPVEVALSVVASTTIATLFFASGLLNVAQFALTVLLYALYLAALPKNLPLPALRTYAVVAAAIVALLFADVVVVQRQLQRRTHFREIASYFKPRMGPLRAGTITFTAPEAPKLAFYLFRQGEYWNTYYHRDSDELFRYDLEHGNRAFYIVDTSATLYGAHMKPEWAMLLMQHTRDVTAEVEQATGTKIGVRVLVPSADQEP